METTTIGVVQVVSTGIHRTGPDAQVADVKFDFLPTVHGTFERVGGGVGGGWNRVRHVAHDPHYIAFTLHAHAGIHVDAGVAADGVQVHITQVAQVHQVVVDQLVRRVVVVDVAVEQVLATAVDRVGRWLAGRLGMRLAAKPDPDDLVLLSHMIGGHFGLARNLVLARDFHACAAFIE
ncbi:hypothetical protein D3C84_881870 [compost metagenome]